MVIYMYVRERLTYKQASNRSHLQALATHLRGRLPSKASLTIRPDLGQIKIKGNYHSRLKEHFMKMGF